MTGTLYRVRVRHTSEIAQLVPELYPDSYMGPFTTERGAWTAVDWASRPWLTCTVEPCAPGPVRPKTLKGNE